MFNRNDSRSYGAPREPYTGQWICSKCQKDTPHTLPFKPTGDRPVYCKDCYKEMKQEQGR